MMQPYFKWAIVGAVSTLCLHCQSGESGPSEASAPVEASTPAPPPAEESGLRRTLDAYGLPVPEGARLEEELTGALHYRIDADYDLLMAFYARELEPGFTLTRYTHGAKLEPFNANGRSIYLYRERGQRGWLLTYFESDNRPGTIAEAGSGTAPDLMPGLPSDPLTFQSRVGEVVEGSAPEPPLPGAHLRRTEPRMHPRVRALMQQRTVEPPPLNFSRGIHVPRQNPNAMY
jgi:hypothetical protein